MSLIIAIVGPFKSVQVGFIRKKSLIVDNELRAVTQDRHRREHTHRDYPRTAVGQRQSTPPPGRQRSLADYRHSLLPDDD